MKSHFVFDLYNYTNELIIYKKCGHLLDMELISWMSQWLNETLLPSNYEINKTYQCLYAS